MMPSRLAAEQVRRNRTRDGHWEASAVHRARVTDCLLSPPPATPARLCILGAGNANDLDLPRLLATYREIHLVDLDADALRRGVDRQVPEPERDRLWLHGGVDLTGVCEALDAVADRQPDDLSDLTARALDPQPVSLSQPQMARAAAAQQPTPYLLPGMFDVVASVGTLSQLIDLVVQSLPATNPHLMQTLLNVRTGHLRLMARLTAPGGRGLLVTDFVSSETVPELASVAATDLPALAERLADERNFFHGLNPLVLPTLFEHDPVLRQLVASVRHRGYWLWNQQSRVYAVLAIESSR